MSIAHVDPNIDWMAHAKQKKRELADRIGLAARIMEEKKNLPLPPPPEIEEPPPQTRAAKPSRFDTLSSYIPLWKQIQLEVCAKYGLHLTDDIYLDKRAHKYTLARHEIFYRLRHEARMSLLQIGMKMKRDHTTVLNGISRHAIRLSKENESCITPKC